jgi:outer membrane protein assembly factor BamB
MKRFRGSVWPLFLSGSLVVALVAVTGAGQERAPGWTQFRGPGGSGISSATGLPTTWSKQENLVWKAPLPGPGTSSPIVVGEKIFLTCYSGYRGSGDMSGLKRHLVCLNAQIGKVLWDKPMPAKLPEQDSIREGHGYASSTLAADSERLYAFFGKTGVFAFDHNGKQLWKADVGSQVNGWGSAASPVLYRDLVIINASVESNALIALDRKSGQERWRAEGINESWATPILVPLAGGKVELVVPIFGKLLGFDPASGQALWNCATEIASYMAPSPVAHDGVVYCIGGRTNGSVAVRAGGRGNVTNSHRLWTSKKGGNVSSPVYHAGHLYWAHDNRGSVYCVVAKTGQVVYEQRVEGAEQFYAAGLLANGNLYYTTRDGRTAVVAAEPRYRLVAINDLSDRSMFNASPAVVGNRILLRSDQFLYCVGKK